MHTPEIRSHVRPALSHSLFVVYERGEAPGYGAWSLAHPAVNAKMTTAMARALIGMTSLRSGSCRERAALPDLRNSVARVGAIPPPPRVKIRSSHAERSLRAK
jgi:hypothetical protein